MSVKDTMYEIATILHIMLKTSLSL